jgi:hypothetical protein
MVNSDIQLNRSPTTGNRTGWLSHPLWATFWRSLRHPVGLLLIAGLLLILQSAALFLPQMPGQLTEDAVERARWLLAAQEPYGDLGALLAWLGLFDFARSYVLRGLLVILILLMAMQVGDLLAMVQRIQLLRRGLAEASYAAGTPLTTPGLQTVYRQRRALALLPDVAAAQLSAQIGRASDTRVAVAGAEGQIVDEERWLRIDHQPFLYLRILLVAAATAALILLWVIITVGWDAQPPLLAPDASFRLASHDLRLSYQVTPGDPNAAPDATAPTLLVSMGAEEGMLDARFPGQLRLGSAEIGSTPADPALVVEAWIGGAPVAALALPGQSGLRHRFSFAFPSVGSEESVLIPGAELGVRLVRLPDSYRFLMEVVSSASDVETQRTEINANDAIVVPYPGAADGELVLRFRYLPMLRVHVQSMPGDWLAIPLLALVLVGGVGLLRRPRFLICQVAPWPPQRSVLVVQSDDSATTTALATWAASVGSSTTEEEDAA